MRAIARKYAEKTLQRPATLFIIYLFAWSALITLSAAITIGIHALYSQFRADGLILYAASYLLFIMSARTLLGGSKEMILFWYQLSKLRTGIFAKLQGGVTFFLDFFVTELFRAGGFAALAIAAFNAAMNGITLDPLLFVGTGALVIGTFVQAILSAAYLRWQVTADAYRRTLITDFTIQELGFLAPAMRQMRSALRSNTLATVALMIYRIAEVFLYFVLAGTLQYLALDYGSDYTFMQGVLLVTTTSLSLAVILLVRQIIREYHLWTTYSKKVLLAGTTLTITTLGSGTLQIILYYQSGLRMSLAPLIAYWWLVLIADITFVIMLFVFSRVVIEDMSGTQAF